MNYHFLIYTLDIRILNINSILIDMVGIFKTTTSRIGLDLRCITKEL